MACLIGLTAARRPCISSTRSGCSSWRQRMPLASLAIISPSTTTHPWVWRPPPRYFSRRRRSAPGGFVWDHSSICCLSTTPCGSSRKSACWTTSQADAWISASGAVSRPMSWATSGSMPLSRAPSSTRPWPSSWPG